MISSSRMFFFFLPWFLLHLYRSFFFFDGDWNLESRRCSVISTQASVLKRRPSSTSVPSMPPSSTRSLILRVWICLLWFWVRRPLIVFFLCRYLLGRSSGRWMGTSMRFLAWPRTLITLKGYFLGQWMEVIDFRRNWSLLFWAWVGSYFCSCIHIDRYPPLEYSFKVIVSPPMIGFR